jgi:hypothetical protein
MILYDDRSSNDEQLLVRPFFDKPKIRTWRAVETQNSYFYFIETTHGLLHLGE